MAEIGERLLAVVARLIGEEHLLGPDHLGPSERREVETARVSRELARIRCELPVPFSLEEFRFQGHDATALPALLRELEFFSLLQDLSPARQPLERCPCPSD